MSLNGYFEGRDGDGVLRNRFTFVPIIIEKGREGTPHFAESFFVGVPLDVAPRQGGTLGVVPALFAGLHNNRKLIFMLTHF